LELIAATLNLGQLWCNERSLARDESAMPLL